MRSWCPSYGTMSPSSRKTRARGGHAASASCAQMGDACDLPEAATLPALTVLSGPAAGVIGAGAIARDVGLTDFITFDMGGTSTDVCLNLDGSASTSRETRIGNIELAIPIVDIVTVGAGGGSIAHVPEATGALRVGPKSAGADPGPACYGRGGAGPTVTDANLLLGFLPPRILAGELSLDIEAAAGRARARCQLAGRNAPRSCRGDLSRRQREHAGRAARGFEPAWARPAADGADCLRRRWADARRGDGRDPGDLARGRPTESRCALRTGLRHRRVPGRVLASHRPAPGATRPHHDRGRSRRHERAGRRVALRA